MGQRKTRNDSSDQPSASISPIMWLLPSHCIVDAVESVAQETNLLRDALPDKTRLSL
jgi:hypothetical protein